MSPAKWSPQRRFTYQLPVTHLTVEVGEWPTGLYRAVVTPAGEKVDGSVRRLSQKMMNLIVRPAQSSHQVLFVAPTDMWRAYASNGGHAMTSWRESWHYDSVGYSPTVLNTRFRRSNHYYYGLYERWSDIKHYRYLRELARQDGLAIDYCTQDDIASGRVRLDDYRLVLLGNHAEFTTLPCFLSFRNYLARGGAVMVHGGDSFAVMVEYLPSLEERRYIWQREHVWMHLTYSSDDFQPPQLLAARCARRGAHHSSRCRRRGRLSERLSCQRRALACLRARRGLERGPSHRARPGTEARGSRAGPLGGRSRHDLRAGSVGRSGSLGGGDH